MEIFLHTETWIALLTLTFLEIVLGVDNIIFISIVSNKLPEHQQPKARKLGLALALIFRILLLLGISYIIKFTQPLVTIAGFDLSARDLILFLGGLFLLFKSTLEIHHKMEGQAQEIKPKSIYFAVFFSLGVEIVNMRMRKKGSSDTVQLNPRIKEKS